MKIAFVDERGQTIGLALRAAAAGHDVVHVATTPAYARIGQGLVGKAPNLLALMPAAVKVDLFLVLAPGLAVQAELLRRAGRAVVGGNAWVERLGWDSAFASALAESAGLKTPHRTAFSSAVEALAVVRADPRKWVVLSDGHAPYASDVPALLESHLRRLGASPVVLREYVPGVELYVETWYHEGRNVFSFAAVENGRFLDADMGPELEAQTSASWTFPMLEPRVYQNVGKRLEVLVEQQAYTGPIGARLIISDRDRKPYLLGFKSGSARHVHACRHALGFDLAEFARAPHKPGDLRVAYSAAVSVPPYPATLYAPGLAAHARGLAVLGGARAYLHDVEADVHRDAEEGGPVMVAGTSGLVGDVVGIGPTVEDARQQAVGHLDDLMVEGKQARRGGGAARLGRDVLRLAALGYETPRPQKVVA